MQNTPGTHPPPRPKAAQFNAVPALMCSLRNAKRLPSLPSGGPACAPLRCGAPAPPPPAVRPPAPPSWPPPPAPLWRLPGQGQGPGNSPQTWGLRWGRAGSPPPPVSLKSAAPPHVVKQLGQWPLQGQRGQSRMQRSSVFPQSSYKRTSLQSLRLTP